jgi:hypothetical protein
MYHARNITWIYSRKVAWSGYEAKQGEDRGGKEKGVNGKQRFSFPCIPAFPTEAPDILTCE